MLTPTQLAEIRERCEKASTAEFLGHARQDIPALLTHIDHLNAQVEKAKEGLKEIVRYQGDYTECAIKGIAQETLAQLEGGQKP